MPQMYISKYNRFVDAVLNRINRMLGKQYDPVRVKLLSQLQRNNYKIKSSAEKSMKKVNMGKKKGTTKIANKMGELEVERSEKVNYDVMKSETHTTEPEFVLISKVGSSNETTVNSKETNEVRASPIRQNNRNKSPSNNNKKVNSSKASSNKKPSGNKTKQSSNKSSKKPKATLFGLSTLKREGDVTVSMQSDYTTVKTNFILGPLTLRVEREVAKSGKRELRSATATTAEMFGRLNLRLVNGGVATLHSIRVLQPKQVRIDTADDHDKTTEFMWKRSPQIATIVSQKLASVARSMLKPPPQPRP